MFTIGQEFFKTFSYSSESLQISWRRLETMGLLYLHVIVSAVLVVLSKMKNTFRINFWKNLVFIETKSDNSSFVRILIVKVFFYLWRHQIQQTLVCFLNLNFKTKKVRQIHKTYISAYFYDVNVRHFQPCFFTLSFENLVWFKHIQFLGTYNTCCSYTWYSTSTS